MILHDLSFITNFYETSEGKLIYKVSWTSSKFTESFYFDERESNVTFL